VIYFLLYLEAVRPEQLQGDGVLVALVVLMTLVTLIDLMLRQSGGRR
jgi:hypothetical protein